MTKSLLKSFVIQFSLFQMNILKDNLSLERKYSLMMKKYLFLEMKSSLFD